MVLVLAAIGAFALRRRWSARAILALGLGLWLFVMVVVMPLTDGGFFATALIDGTRATIGGYLAVALTYAAALALAGSMLVGRRARARHVADRPAPIAALATELASTPSRRSALVMLGGAVASFAATFLVVRMGPRQTATRVVVLDPQEPVPSGGIDPPNPHPNLVEDPQAARDRPPPAPNPTAEAPAGPAGGNPAPAPPSDNRAQADAARSDASEFPEPRPARQLARDKDGAVLPSGRRPGELAERITSSDDFYVVTKNAAGDPVLRASEWRLRIDGNVQRPIELDYASLRNLPAVEVTKTLECISNFVTKCELAPFGCDLISTARWKGARLADVLDLAGGLKPGTQSLVTISADEFSTGLPLEVALDQETLLVYEMNGEVLPREHGYPARILVPGRYGMKNAKWVVALRPMAREFVDWYGQRNWSKQGIVKTMTRIDTPARGAELPPGEHRIAGIAYAGDRGIARVEFRIGDEGNWQTAELLEPADATDVWVRWGGRFTLAPGAALTLAARATDGTGALQIEEFSLPQPDGSNGWHTCEVTAKSA